MRRQPFAPEIIQADPRAVPEAQKRRVILKGNHIAQQRQVAKDEEEHQSGRDQGIHPAIAPNALEQARAPG